MLRIMLALSTRTRIALDQLVPQQRAGLMPAQLASLRIILIRMD